jgi:peptidyl-prolyl cis-trans isomerase D
MPRFFCNFDSFSALRKVVFQMLKAMRDSFHNLKWVLLAVVVAFIFGFVFIDMGLGGGFSSTNTEDTNFAARVNGETITPEDYARAYRNYENVYRGMYGEQWSPQIAQQMGLPRQVLDALVDRELLSQEADRLNLTATPEEVRRKLLTMETFQREGKFVGVELYTRYVTSQLGYRTAAEFEEDLARDITVSKIESALTSSVVISPKAAEAEYKRTTENAKIRYVLLPAAQQAATIKVTPAEVEAYYRANQAKYTHGEQRNVRYLLADLNKIRANITPTDENLRKFYNDNREQFKANEAAKVQHILVKVDPNAAPTVDAAAKAKAEGIVAQLRGGSDFAALARANSDDPSSSSMGGEMGWVERGLTVAPFEQAIFSIPLNTISDPIRTPEFGYHIVRVTERRPAGYRSFEEVKPELVARGASELAQEQARNEINRVHTQIRAKKPANVTEFAALAGGNVTSNDGGWVAKNEQIAGIGNNPPLVEWIFAAQKGDISQPVGTGRGPAVAYVVDVRPAGISTLNEIKDRVTQDLKLEKARQQVRGTLSAFMAGATSLDQVAQRAQQSVRDASANRQGPIAGIAGDASELIEAAINGTPGGVKGPILVPDGAVAFEIVEQKKVTPQEIAENRAQFIDTLREQQARSLRSSLVQRLRKASEIEINEQLVEPAPQQAGL